MKKLGLALALTLIPLCVTAQEIKGIRYSPSTVNVDTEVLFYIDMNYRPNTSLIWCSVEVDFGNGETKKIRLGDDFKVKETLTVPYTYAKPGEYVASVDGSFFIEGLTKVPAPPCEGKKQQISLKVFKPTPVDQPVASVEQPAKSERSGTAKLPSTPPSPKVRKEPSAPVQMEQTAPKVIDPPPAKVAPKPKAESIL